MKTLKYNVVLDLVNLIECHTNSVSDYSVMILNKEQIENFHEMATPSYVIGCFYIERNAGESLYLLFTDWQEKNNENYHLILFPKNRSGPIAELHKTQTIATLDNSGINLLWEYNPRKQDGRNKERINYFKKYFGNDVNVCISLPASQEDIQYFFDDLISLVNNRLKADTLSEETPDVRFEFPEGRIYEKLHKLRERNSQLIKLAKENMRKRQGKLICQICDFDFGEKYGTLGEDFIEAHHTLPVSQLHENSTTKIEDIALVCSNCHRMLHRKRPWLEMSELKKILVTI
jgi:hypothetical protein